jgi:hypothetical protein
MGIEYVVPFWGDTLEHTLTIWFKIAVFWDELKSFHRTPTFARLQREEDKVYAENFLILRMRLSSRASLTRTSFQRAPIAPAEMVWVWV